MKTPTTLVRIDTPYGALYVAVVEADEYSYYDTDRGNVTELRPCLRAASDPAFEADPDVPEHWTIRKRAYGVHYLLHFEDLTHIEYVSGARGERWHRNGGAPYKGGFRNDKRQPVEFRTATYDAMWAALTGALDTFAEQYPQWQELSRYLFLRGRQARHEGKAANLRREASAEETTALEFARRAAELSGSISDSMLSLITG